MNLNHLIQDKKTNFSFQIKSIADLNAVSGFISTLGIKRRQAIIKCGLEVAQATAKKMLKGYTVNARRKLPENCLPVKFDNEGPARLAADGGLIMNYIPYKYFVPVQASFEVKIRLRTKMKIKKDRKIIIISCSGRSEADVVLKAYGRLSHLTKPLLIFGFRKPDISWAKQLIRRGFRVNDRRSIGEPISSFGGSDIVILNTMGELFNLMHAADLAIIGHDRNIFEPALLGVPILYFECPLNMSKNEKKMANLFRLIWRKNKTAKNLLARTGGAIRIDSALFHKQITKLLDAPEKVTQGARRAVKLFHRKYKPLKL